MSSERMGVFWTFVDTDKFDKALKCIGSDFQCNALHPDRRTTQLVEVIASGICCPPSEEQNVFKLIKALRDRGVSWTQACNRSPEKHAIWKKSDPENTKITQAYGTHSAVSFTQAWLRQLHGKQEWERSTVILHKVLEMFLEELPTSRTKVAIDEDIVSKL